MKAANSALEREAKDRRNNFGREAALAYSMLSSVLADLGASVANIGGDDCGISEPVFCEWLQVEFSNFRRILSTSSSYAARFTAEAVVGLLERSGCSDTSKLASDELVVDGTAQMGFQTLGRKVSNVLLRTTGSSMGRKLRSAGLSNSLPQFVLFLFCVL